jgi:hypothetical protein
VTDETRGQLDKPEPGVDPDREEVQELLDGIPGFRDRLAVAKAEISRGDGLPLDEL